MALLFLLLSILPQPDDVLRDRVDVIEINHHYNEKGEHLHDQLIFWDWHWDTTILAQAAEYDACTGEETSSARPEWRGARFHVVDWYLIRGGRRDLLPQPDWTRGGYTSFWDDKGDLREVRAPSIRETWTQNRFPCDHHGDPDTYEKNYILPEAERRKLKPGRPKKPFVLETPAAKCEDTPNAD